MFSFLRKFRGGRKLALMLLTGLVVVSVGYGTWETITLVGTDSDDRVWIPTTVSGPHKLAAHVATGCDLRATVETPLGTEIVLEVDGVGPCLADVGPLGYYPDGYYGMMAQQTCTSGNTSKVYLADEGTYYKIPNCNPN